MPRDLIAPDRLRVGVNPQDTDNSRVRIVGEDRDGTNFIFGKYRDSSDSTDIIYRAARGTVVTPANLQLDDYIVNITGEARSTSFFRTAAIRFRVAAAVVAGQVPASCMEFFTNQNNEAQTGKMYLNQFGHLGIGPFVAGSADVKERLHSMTTGGVTLQWGLQVQNPTSTVDAAVGIVFTTSNNTDVGKGAIAYVRDASGNGRGRMVILQDQAADNTKAEITDVVIQIENNGFTGIGSVWTSAVLPSSLFHVANNGTAHEIIERASTNSSSPKLRFFKSRGTMAAKTNVADQDVLGTITGEGTSGGTMFETAKIEFVVDGAVVDGQRPGSALDFYTNAINTASVAAWRISQDGRLQQRIAGNESTGAGAALLGANSPAGTLAAPYKWIAMRTSDASTVYFPVWK